jgi:hypothetical protein
MAAQTVGDWTVSTVGIKKNFMVATCQCTTDANNEILFTKRTGTWLDGSKPWTLIIAASAAQDGAATPVALHLGYADNFALAGTTARATITSGAIYGNFTDDLGYAAAVLGMAFQMTPSSSGLANIVTIAAIATGMRFNCPIAPYYAFELYAADGATLLAHTLTFTIIQKK